LAEVNVSVIIPALNEADEIAATIEACVISDTKGLIKEIIVSDGGSSDKTVEIAKQSGARCVESQRSGRAIQMNLGASDAKGEILLFVHADTRLPVGWSESISDAIGKGYSAGCFQLGFGHPSYILRVYGWLTRFDMDLVRFGDQGLYILKEHFDKLGGYREDHRVLEDNEFTRRIRAAGIKFKVMEKVAITSPRRYLEQGKIRLQLIFMSIYLMWRLGVSQDNLIAFYRRMVANRVPV
jgi:rSAM/selenodomain-associated transferase 2